MHYDKWCTPVMRYTVYTSQLCTVCVTLTQPPSSLNLTKDLVHVYNTTMPAIQLSTHAQCILKS